ncbi:hypothetical protein ZWY2020_043714 [Hordeum vulgare]|nr:hypothetical protein ZWY2020_043714 [Hordeum vulgare]
MALRHSRAAPRKFPAPSVPTPNPRVIKKKNSQPALPTCRCPNPNQPKPGPPDPAIPLAFDFRRPHVSSTESITRGEEAVSGKQPVGGRQAGHRLRSGYKRRPGAPSPPRALASSLSVGAAPPVSIARVEGIRATSGSDRSIGASVDFALIFV